LDEQMIERFKKLPNNVYRIFFREAGSYIEQQLNQLNVIDNKIVPSAVFVDQSEQPELLEQQDPDATTDPGPGNAAAQPDVSDGAQLHSVGDPEDSAKVLTCGVWQLPASQLVAPSAGALTRLSGRTLAAALLIAATPQDSWRRCVEHAMGSGMVGLDKTARLLRRWRDE
jgi:hypothetical protein